ncbi:FkbM family methyltransferase, partial [Halochromatium roseum]|uniref:FkbM family methyltransferase n=1 Tax=Halochromatium roseum TaxID=391920 RepID=UPI003B839F85
PAITYVEKISLPTKTINRLIRDQTLPNDIDFLLLDTQGAEGLILDGADLFLANDCLVGCQIETGVVPLYEHGSTYLEIAAKLAPFNLHLKYAYYDDFSNLLVINRGVHEPLEEYCFQEILKRLPSRPFMLELGALWAHYSMWCKQQRPNAEACMVEPEPDNLESGRLNFARHGYSGRFIQAKVGPDDFKVDAFMAESGWDKLDILHVDIQGAELAMLDDARQALERRQVDYLFLSTHSQQLHHQCAERLTKLGYVVVVSADFDNQTTSYDGFLLAVNPLLAPPGSAAP